MIVIYYHISKFIFYTTDNVIHWQRRHVYEPSTECTLNSFSHFTGIDQTKEDGHKTNPLVGREKRRERVREREEERRERDV